MIITQLFTRPLFESENDPITQFASNAHEGVAEGHDDEDPFELSSDYALHIANAGRKMMTQLANMSKKIQTDSTAAQNANRWNLGDFMHQHYETDDLNAINQVFEEYGVGGFFDQNLYELLSNWSSQGPEYVTAWKQYSGDVIKNSTRQPSAQSVHEQGVAEGSLNELSSDLLKRSAQAATDKRNQAMDPELHNALGGGYMNPLATHYDNVSQKMDNRAAQVRKKETIQKIASKIASPAVMRKMGMSDMEEGVAEAGNANSGRRGPDYQDNSPVVPGRVEHLPQGLRHHADASRYGGTEPDDKDDRLLGPQQRHRLHRAVTPDDLDEQEKIAGRHDPDDFDDMIGRLKKLAGAGPLKTVWDPAKRVYKNVPHAVQPAQQPKKAPQ